MLRSIHGRYIGLFLAASRASIAWRNSSRTQKLVVNRRARVLGNGQASAAGTAPPLSPDGTTEAQSTAGPPSGYSRRRNRSPRRCYKTVRASCPAHGSSVIRPLSWAPLRACDLHVGASPFRVIPTSLNGVLTASAARLIPITDIPPSPRQPIHGLSPRRWLLGESRHRVVSGGHLLTDAASFILGSSAKPVA